MTTSEGVLPGQQFFMPPADNKRHFEHYCIVVVYCIGKLDISSLQEDRKKLLPAELLLRFQIL